MNRPTRLTVTPLEDRLTPAGFGNTWIDTNLTVSFAPDGTDVSGAPSALFGALGARMTTAEWQDVVRGAIQEWASVTNLNFAIVPDDGRPIGSPGPMQGSPHVGDIRISARPLSDNVMAITNPPDLISPYAGEIILNSNKVFDTDGSPGTVDLRTVMLQEVGHALGLGNSDDECSVMYEHGGSPCMDAEDVAAIQALYGVRQADRFDDLHPNATLMTSSGLTYIQESTDLVGTDGTQGAWPFVALGDITTGDDIDTYYVTPPKEQINPTVVIQTGGMSSVRLQVSVYYRVASAGANAGRLLATTSTADADGNYVLPFTPTAGWYTYYIRVHAASDAGPFNVGSYRLAMGNGLTAIPESQYTTKISTPSGTVTESSDWASGRSANDTLATAIKLGIARDSSDARWDYSGTATFGSASDTDTYEVRTAAKSGNVLLVSVNTAGGSDPVVTVFDGRGNALATETLLRNGNVTIVQLRGAKQNATYYVSVREADPAKWAGPAAYQIGIDFRAAAVALDTFAAGTLTEAAPQLARTLEVTRSQMFRFQMTATDAADAVATAARFTVFDANGTAVFTMVSRNGQTVIGDVLLAPGTYTVVIAGATIDGSPLKGLQIDARYMTLTDPIGPELVDDYSTTTTSTARTTTTTTTTTTGYLWLAPATSGSGFLEPTSLYSSPWW